MWEFENELRRQFENELRRQLVNGLIATV